MTAWTCRWEIAKWPDSLRVSSANRRSWIAKGRFYTAAEREAWGRVLGVRGGPASGASRAQGYGWPRSTDVWGWINGQEIDTSADQRSAPQATGDSGPQDKKNHKRRTLMRPEKRPNLKSKPFLIREVSMRLLRSNQGP